MLRICLWMFLSVVSARWIYSEVELMAPGVLPYIDSAVSAVSIPTHDKWETKELEKLIKKVTPSNKTLVSAEASMRNQKLQFPKE